MYGCVWKLLLSLQHDPMDYVATAAQSVVNSVQNELTEKAAEATAPSSPLSRSGANFLTRSISSLSVSAKPTSSPQVQRRVSQPEPFVVQSSLYEWTCSHYQT